MDRSVLDVIQRELDDEVRTRFPGGTVRQVALLQYGDDPHIEPRDLWVRVLLDSDGPEDYDRSWKVFADAHQAAIDELPRYLAEKLHEIMKVEFRFADNAGTRGDLDGPQWGYYTGDRLSEYQEWERGVATFVHAPMGPSGLETLDTLILAGVADSRGEAICTTPAEALTTQGLQKAPPRFRGARNNDMHLVISNCHQLAEHR